MKILLTILCALGIGSVSAQTFNHFEDASFTGTKVFHHDYQVTPAKNTTQPLRLWACVTGMAKPLAAVTLTWQHSGVQVTKQLNGVDSGGLRKYQVDADDLIGLSAAGDWSLTVKASGPVFLQNWGVLDIPDATAKQYCPTHRLEGGVTTRGVIKGGVVAGQPQTNVTYTVYAHGSAPPCSWTNCSVTIIPAVKQTNRTVKPTPAERPK
jgi:hypothetical protein